MDSIESYDALARPLRERAAQRIDPERQAQLQALFATLEREQAQQAPAIGDQAPDFALQEAGTGRTVQLSDAVTRGPVVLSFYRGQWCPYCNLEVRALQSIHDDVRALGGDIYLIGPETEENALKLREKTESTIPLLFDGAAEVCRAYGLAFELPAYFQDSYRAAGNDLPMANPGVGWTLPIPATFVIGPDRIVTARHVDPDYRERMEPADILAAARSVSA
ncbi:MAG: peroxiredoxin-like family protein [Dehalococcoidia bacterium]